MSLDYQVKSIGGFLDGNVLPQRLSPGEVIVVDEVTWKKLQQSAPGDWELLGKVVPPSTVKKEPEPEESQLQPRCAALNARGTQCQRPSNAGSEFCSSHQPQEEQDDDGDEA